MPRIMGLTVQMNAVSTVSIRRVAVVLDHVYMAVKEGSTETSVTRNVVVVWRDVTKTLVCVWGRVRSENTGHVVSTGAVIPVNKDVSKYPVSAVAVLTGDTDTCVTRPVVLVVTQAVTDTMEAVRVNKAGKARHVVSL